MKKCVFLQHLQQPGVERKWVAPRLEASLRAFTRNITTTINGNFDCTVYTSLVEPWSRFITYSAIPAAAWHGKRTAVPKPRSIAMRYIHIIQEVRLIYLSIYLSIYLYIYIYIHI